MKTKNISKLLINIKDENLAKRFRSKCLSENVSLTEVVIKLIKEWAGEFDLETRKEPKPFFDLF